MYALGVVLVLYAVSASIYGAVHQHVMARAESIPVRVRWAIAVRERVVVPAGLISAGGAVLALSQGCGLALSALVIAAGLSSLADGAIAVALTRAGRDLGPQIELTHALAGAGALSGPQLLSALRSARSAADARARRQTPEA